jgi:cytidylate kinase
MRPIMRAVSEETFRDLSPEPSPWTPAADERRARDEWIDRESDRRMLETIDAKSGVFDAWALPWLCDEPDAIRVWIEADLASRAERCLLSYEMEKIDPPADPYALLEEKDSFSRRQFRKLYGIELGPDPEVFDLILENSKPMSEHSSRVATADARAFNDVLHSRIQGILTAREEAGGP